MSIHLNLLVIYSHHPEKSVSFYKNLGLEFNLEKHGNGPEHYACELGNLVFEIYPSLGETVDRAMRIGFNITNLDEVIEKIRSINGLIITEPTINPWGSRAVIQDPDGHKVELIENRD
ncbi:VOC family protein [Lederbergia lenta]|uniref:VOC family protein n=1 Tax=Lederbergia lenta TaxID=1467 RepID=UPI00203B9556|nr:VOC family protein [Lederbergia lenta]MCM3109575.1 VOC family protein [Lederbergia lenta]